MASKHGNLRQPLNASSMALESTNCWQRHGVGKGGGTGPGRVTDKGGGGDGERTRNVHGTDTVKEGEAGGGKEAKGWGREKGDRWWRAFKRNRGSTK